MEENTKKIYEKYGIDPEYREKENLDIINKRYEELDSINKSMLKEKFDENFEANFDSLKHFLRENHFYYFKELESNIWQIVQCLIIEAHSASITLTNHMLERTFKLALIQHEVGVLPIDPKKFNETYRPSHKYSSWNLSKTIAECEKLGLINATHVEILTAYRLSLRNGFSHYDPTVILREANDTKEMIVPGNDPKNDSRMSLNYKEIPILQYIFVNQFAQENARIYFEFVCEIIGYIEKQFKGKYYANSLK